LKLWRWVGKKKKSSFVFVSLSRLGLCDNTRAEIWLPRPIHQHELSQGQQTSPPKHEAKTLSNVRLASGKENTNKRNFIPSGIIVVCSKNRCFMN
jgi:hypothetical protein